MNHNEYSNTVNDPEFITGLTKAIKKDFRFYRIFGSTPFVIWIGFIIGVNQRIVFPYKTLIVYAVCIIVTIVIETIRIKHLNNGTWEGVVVNKGMYGSTEPYETAEQTYVVIKNSDGKKKRVWSLGDIYSYLKKGDRVIVHPNYPFKLEPSDKEKYGKLFCSMCGRENTISAIRCYKCDGVLLR